jgi:anti-sigma factor RsiW
MTENPACRRSTEGLTEYLENALSPRRRQGIERHLEQCEGCRRRLAQLRQIVEASGTIPGARMPAETKARLLLRLRELTGSEAEGADQR